MPSSTPSPSGDRSPAPLAEPAARRAMTAGRRTHSTTIPHLDPRRTPSVGLKRCSTVAGSDAETRCIASPHVTFRPRPTADSRRNSTRPPAPGRRARTRRLPDLPRDRAGPRGPGRDRRRRRHLPLLLRPAAPALRRAPRVRSARLSRRPPRLRRAVARGRLVRRRPGRPPGDSPWCGADARRVRHGWSSMSRADRLSATYLDPKARAQAELRATNLRRLRLERGWTSTFVAAGLGVSRCWPSSTPSHRRPADRRGRVSGFQVDLTRKGLERTHAPTTWQFASAVPGVRAPVGRVPTPRAMIKPWNVPPPIPRSSCRPPVAACGRHMFGSG